MIEYLVLTLDCADAQKMTDFWCAAVGYEVAGGVGQYTALVHPGSAMPKMLLQEVHEPKSAKNRLHLDLHVPDIEAEATRLEELGAIRLERVDEFGTSWVPMVDPEGNEFCVCPTDPLAPETPAGQRAG